MLLNKFHSSSGMKTKQWGPSTWTFLFTSILGTYPLVINNYDYSHILIRDSFKNMLLNLQHTMPCIYCRQSFKQFIQELPIEKFLIGRIELMYWLYLIKDKVNNKLIKQEQECFDIEKQKIENLLKSKKISRFTYNQKIQELKEDIFYTKPSPPFIEVLEKYEASRAVCSNKTCK